MLIFRQIIVAFLCIIKSHLLRALTANIKVESSLKYFQQIVIKLLKTSSS